MVLSKTWKEKVQEAARKMRGIMSSGRDKWITTEGEELNWNQVFHYRTILASEMLSRMELEMEAEERTRPADLPPEDKQQALLALPGFGDWSGLN